LADFVQKGPKRGRTSGKFDFLLFFSLILGKSKNYYTFPSDTVKDNFVSKGKRRLQKGKIARRPNFPTELAGKVCQELAALIIICRSVSQ
jgi:hypothetical protein